jgi:excisionase family DNA binding protein
LCKAQAPGRLGVESIGCGVLHRRRPTALDQQVLRRSLDTALVHAGVDRITTRAIMGHTSEQNDGALRRHWCQGEGRRRRQGAAEVELGAARTGAEVVPGGGHGATVRRDLESGLRRIVVPHCSPPAGLWYVSLVRPKGFEPLTVGLEGASTGLADSRTASDTLATHAVGLNADSTASPEVASAGTARVATMWPASAPGVPVAAPPERLLTVREVAEALGVCTATVYSLVRSGGLAHVRVANCIRISWSALPQAGVASFNCEP